MSRSAALAIAGALALAGPAGAQAIMQPHPQPAPSVPQPGAAPPGAAQPDAAQPAGAGTAGATTANEGAAPLRGVSLFLVTPPAPRAWQKNDLIEIIVNETSLQKHEQNVDAKKDYTLGANVKSFPSIRDLWEAQIRNGDSHAPASVDVTAKKDFKGDGKYERKDTFTARITATVLEVKPNGTLVLEASKTVKSNDEESSLVLSGVCRPDDITQNNTIQSSQLANLVLRVRNAGDVKNAANKGIIARALDTIFNF